MLEKETIQNETLDDNKFQYERYKAIHYLDEGKSKIKLYYKGQYVTSYTSLEILTRNAFCDVASYLILQDAQRQVLEEWAQNDEL